MRTPAQQSAIQILRNKLTVVKFLLIAKKRYTDLPTRLSQRDLRRVMLAEGYNDTFAWESFPLKYGYMVITPYGFMEKYPYGYDHYRQEWNLLCHEIRAIRQGNLARTKNLGYCNI